MVENKSQMQSQNLLKSAAATKTEPAKKSTGSLFKLILVLAIIGLIVYLFLHPEVIQGSANKFFNNLLK